jgi:hypothetical protein
LSVIDASLAWCGHRPGRDAHQDLFIRGISHDRGTGSDDDISPDDDALSN